MADEKEKAKLRRRCWNCVFWRPQSSEPRCVSGECRKRAPVAPVALVPYGFDPVPPVALWPVTWHDDFCGDWKLNPAAQVKPGAGGAQGSKTVAVAPVGAGADVGVQSGTPLRDDKSRGTDEAGADG